MKNMLQLFAWLMIININGLWASNTTGGNIENDIESKVKVYTIPNTTTYKTFDQTLFFTVGGKIVGMMEVSKYALSLLPPKFRDLINVDKEQLTIALPEANAFKYFAYLIHFVHDPFFLKNEALSVDDLKQLILMTEQYYFDDVNLKKNLLKKLVMTIDDQTKTLIDRIKIADFCLQHLDEYECPKVRAKAGNFLIAEFKDIRKLYTDYTDKNNKNNKDNKDNREKFINLSPQAVLAWVKSSKITDSKNPVLITDSKNPVLITDSENSVFYVIMLWMDKNQRYLGDFSNIIKYFDFYNMRIEYLLDIVRGEKVKQIINHENTFKYLEKRVRKALNHRIREIKHLPKRTLLPDNNKVMIKCAFQEVNKWEESGKYYSSPVLVNGYEFFYFLQKEGRANGGVAGFLRCSGALVPSQHYLPIAYNIAIQTPNHHPHERKFSEMKVVFENSDKAIGGKITVNGESWPDFVQGRNPMVFNNVVTVIVTIEFLANDTGCLSLRNDEDNQNNQQL